MKAIIFDWGGVCCSPGEPFASQALKDMLQLTADEITDKVRGIYGGYYTGKYNQDSFWGAIIKFFDLEENLEINPTTLSDAYLNSYEVFQDVLDLILELKKEYKIALLSNLTPEMRDCIRKNHTLEKYFNLEVYSCDHDVQSMKPSPEPFQKVLNKINLLPEDCLFIDDSPENIETAAGIGMKTLLFKDRQQFFEDINRFISK